VVNKVPKKTTKKLKVDDKLVELTADLQRIQADFINYKRRSEEEMDQRVGLGQQMTIAVVLPTLDNLERAIMNLPKDLKENAWAQGVSKSMQQLKIDMQKLGVEKVKTVGETFNPEFMEAVSVEGEGENEVVSEEIQSGYTINNELLRHAVVKVERK